MSTSCGTDFYQGKRPTDYEETIWKSSDPDVWFEIGKRDDMGILPDTKGEAITEEGTVAVYVWFDHGNTVEFGFEEEDENGIAKMAFLGKCKFYYDKLVVTPYEGKDYLYNGKYDTITFIREDLTE